MLGQVDADLSARFARNYTTAAFGYARAMSAVYAAMANQTLGFWANAARSPEPPRFEPASPYLIGRPRRAEPTPTPFDYFQMANPWLDSRSPAYASVKAWWSLFPLQGDPASWPMAYNMMTAGVPRDVALPTAEANMAVMEAAENAAQAVKGVFSSYHTESGYASSQVRSLGLVSSAWLVPLGAMATWPWFS